MFFRDNLKFLAVVFLLFSASVGLGPVPGQARTQVNTKLAISQECAVSQQIEKALIAKYQQEALPAPHVLQINVPSFVHSMKLEASDLQIRFPSGITEVVNKNNSVSQLVAQVWIQKAGLEQLVAIPIKLEL